MPALRNKTLKTKLNVQKQDIENNTEVDRRRNVLRGQVKKNGNVDRNFIDV